MMYATLLIAHSLLRWVVLGALLISIGRAYLGYSRDRPFSRGDNALRHWTATLAHIQLIIGMILYIKSPVVQYFWSDPGQGLGHMDASFFGLYHLLLMLTAIVLLTVGSALAKRRPTDQEKYKTMLIWFSLALGIIFIAIPWPFSPLANRPYFQTF